MKKNILIVILIVLVLGFASYTVYDKVIKNDSKQEVKTETKSESNEEKEIDINSDLVKNLVYPNVNSNVEIYGDDFYLLKNENASDYSVKDKVFSGANYSNTIIEENISCKEENNKIKIDSSSNMYFCTSYDATKIENNIKKIYGPDTNYKAQNLDGFGCGEPKYYDEGKNLYYGKSSGCGGMPSKVSYLTKNYKSFIKADYLYVYSKSIITLHNSADDSYYIFKNFEEFNSISSDYDKLTGPSYSNKQEVQAKFAEMVKNNEANTYVWTFKKQSDGKYYFDSGKWEA